MSTGSRKENDQNEVDDNNKIIRDRLKRKDSLKANLCRFETVGPHITPTEQLQRLDNVNRNSLLLVVYACIKGQFGLTTALYTQNNIQVTLVLQQPYTGIIL